MVGIARKLLITCAMFGYAFAQPAQAQSSPPPAAPPDENSGQDPTRPVTRVDFRLKYEDGVGGVDNLISTLRADKPFELGGGWKLNGRVDIPLVASNALTPTNPNGSREFGLGDILLQGLFITPPHGKTAFAFGAQMIIPSGTSEQFTSGKWRLVPSAAVVYQLPEIRPGSFLGMVVRDDFSFAGDDARPDTNVVAIQPILNLQFPQSWFGDKSETGSLTYVSMRC